MVGEHPAGVDAGLRQLATSNPAANAAFRFGFLGLDQFAGPVGQLPKLEGALKIGTLAIADRFVQGVRPRAEYAEVIDIEGAGYDIDVHLGSPCLGRWERQKRPGPTTSARAPFMKLLELLAAHVPGAIAPQLPAR